MTCRQQKGQRRGSLSIAHSPDSILRGPNNRSLEIFVLNLKGNTTQPAYLGGKSQDEAFRLQASRHTPKSAKSVTCTWNDQAPKGVRLAKSSL